VISGRQDGYADDNATDQRKAYQGDDDPPPPLSTPGLFEEGLNLNFCCGQSWCPVIYCQAHKATMIGVMKPVKRPESDDADILLDLARVDREAQAHLHEQVAAEIRRAIAEGEAGPGQRVPQAKDLAAVLGVNTNTVLRALRLLRDEGLLEMGRGKAIRVTGTPDQGAVVARTKDLIAFARSRGYRSNEFSELVQRLLHE